MNSVPSKVPPTMDKTTSPACSIGRTSEFMHVPGLRRFVEHTYAGIGYLTASKLALQAEHTSIPPVSKYFPCVRSSTVVPFWTCCVK